MPTPDPVLTDVCNLHVHFTGGTVLFVPALAEAVCTSLAQVLAGVPVVDVVYVTWPSKSTCKVYKGQVNDQKG